MAAAGSTSTNSLVPSEVGSGRPIPSKSLSPPDPTAIVEVNGSQVEDVEEEQVPIQSDVAPVEKDGKAKSPPKEPTRHLNYYERMALEEDARAAAAAAADKADETKADETKGDETKGDETMGGETEGPEDSKNEETSKEHHILSPLQEKILTRSQQDAMFAAKGKGRGRGKGRGKGKGKGKGKDRKVRKGKGSKTPKSSPSVPAPKRKTRRGKKDPVARTLFQSDDDEWQEEPKSKPSPALKRPAAKSKANPKSKAKKDAVMKGEGKGVTEPKPKKARQSNGMETGDKPEIPIFSKCTVIPYWSRVACGLKVSALSHKRDGDEDEPKSGLRQVFYIGIKGASMQEHINVIVEIAPGYII